MARFALALAVFVVFTVYSVEVVVSAGPLALLDVVLAGGWSTQIFLDLVIASVFASLWLVPDAKRRGLAAWPYLVALPLVGSVATLAYVVVREWKAARAPERGAAPTA